MMLQLTQPCPSHHDEEIDLVLQQMASPEDEQDLDQMGPIRPFDLVREAWEALAPSRERSTS